MKKGFTIGLAFVLLAVLVGIGIVSCAPPKPAKVTVWCWDPNFNGASMKAAAAVYNKAHPNVTIDVVDIPQDIDAKIEAGLQANGSGLPDIALFQDFKIEKFIQNYPEGLRRPQGRRHRLFQVRPVQGRPDDRPASRSTASPSIPAPPVSGCAPTCSRPRASIPTTTSEGPQMVRHRQARRRRQGQDRQAPHRLRQHELRFPAHDGPVNGNPVLQQGRVPEHREPRPSRRPSICSRT